MTVMGSLTENVRSVDVRARYYDRKAIAATLMPHIRGVLIRIVGRVWIDVEQLDLKARLGSFECKRDVLSLDARSEHLAPYVAAWVYCVSVCQSVKGPQAREIRTVWQTSA